MAEPDASDFLRAAVSPAAWAGQSAWRCLDTAFGNGQQFFAVWDAWRRDEHRPRVLHYVGLCVEPPRFDDLAQGMAQPALRGFVAQLRQQSLDLGAGFHRLSFENGRLLLTLCIGDLSSLLREQRFQADALLLDPDPAMAALGSRWDLWRVKALARLACRGAVLALRRDTAALLRPVLQQCGFVMPENRGPEPSAVISAEFHPAWALKSSRPGAVTPALPVSRCVVVGAGLAGASVAAALARRGWQVLVLDASPSPAQGASSLPAGLVVPHVSVDDCSLSRLSRAGVRLVLQQAQALLLRGQDWDGTGVEQRYPGGNGHAPGTPALWHAQAGWVKPASLVRAWLAQPGVRFQGGCTVAGLQRHHGLWHVLDAAGQSMACAEQVVLANAIGVAPLLAACSAAEPGLDTFARQPTLRKVDGQVSWALHTDSPALALSELPDFPVNGAGSLLPRVPMPGGTAWLAGATYQPNDEPDPGEQAHHAANRARLARLLPVLAEPLAPMFASGQVQAWRGSRCVSGDRLPLVGPLGTSIDQGLWLCAAMGSRGLTLAALCAEVLAARWGAEPLPVEASLARALAADRGKPSAL